MLILTQFLFRLSFGLSLSMAITPPSKVTSGYYRNHLYVLLGLNVLAALVAVTSPDRFRLWPPAAAAGLSYVGAVVWLYEKRRTGIAVLLAIAATTLAGAWLSAPMPVGETVARKAESPSLDVARLLHLLDSPTSGLVLGASLAAMFLGHWYLNTPTMEIAPLERLILLIGVAIIARAIVCGLGLTMQIAIEGFPPWPFVTLRWLSGLIGALGLCVMAWTTLKIPNTQSATGILYVGVIAVFLGELTSQLLSAQTLYPV